MTHPEYNILDACLAKDISIAVIMSVYCGDCPEKFSMSLSSIVNQINIDNAYLKIYIGVDGKISNEIDAVIKEYFNKIYKIFYFDKNRGLVFVLNDLIGRLEDEQFVFRMDADDFSHETRFQKQLAELHTNKNVDILGTAIWEVQTGMDRRLVNFARSHEDAVRKIHWRVPVAHPTVCFRRSVLQTLGGYPPTPMNEDVALWFECIAHGFKFGNLQEPLLDFTVSESFFKRRGSKKAFGEFLVYTRGIWKIFGLTWKYIIPMIRLVFRLLPTSLQKQGYQSNFRRRSEK